MFNTLKQRVASIVFKTSNYDLNKDERKAKYKGYDIIFCEKCKQQFGRKLFYCKHCYNKETNEEERNRMKFGRCKGCSQVCTEDYWCSSCGSQNSGDIKKQIVIKTSDYDLNWDERKAKFKDYGNLNLQ